MKLPKIYKDKDVDLQLIKDKRIGIIGFGVAMTAIVLLMLRLDWSRVLGRVVPWTLEDDDDAHK